MAITRALIDSIAAQPGGDTTIVSNSVDTSSYKGIVAVCKHEGAAADITATDNKGSGAYTILTPVNHSNSDLNCTLCYATIGTPGTGTIVTITLSGSRSFRQLLLYGINYDGTGFSLNAQSSAQGTSVDHDAGSLTTSAASVSIGYVGRYTSMTATPSAGWGEDYDDNYQYGMSRTDASAGTFDPAATATNGAAWVAIAASFIELGTGVPIAWLRA
jgi:hypothetical protein